MIKFQFLFFLVESQNLAIFSKWNATSKPVVLNWEKDETSRSVENFKNPTYLSVYIICNNIIIKIILLIINWCLRSVRLLFFKLLIKFLLMPENLHASLPKETILKFFVFQFSNIEKIDDNFFILFFEFRLCSGWEATVVTICNLQLKNEGP